MNAVERVAERGGQSTRRSGASLTSPPDRRVRCDGRVDGELVERLLADVAGALGIDVGSITVHVDDESAARTRARRARGLSAGRQVDLDPAAFDPRSARGRALLAHEIVHVAQRDDVARVPNRIRPNVTAAEQEAQRTAERFAAGRTVRRPVATLPSEHVAADLDWAGRADLEQALDAIDESVRDSRPSEWATLEGAFDAENRISADHADHVVDALAGVPIIVARSLVHVLVPARRLALVKRFTNAHRGNHRPVVIAAMAALDRGSAEELTKGDLEGIELLGLEEMERNLYLLALSRVRQELITELLAEESNDPERPARLHALVNGEDLSLTPVTVMLFQAEEEARRDTNRQRQRERNAARIAERVNELRRQIRGRTSDAEAAARSLGAEEEDDRRDIVAALEQSGDIERLLDKLDDNDGPGTQLVDRSTAAILSVRATSANLATVSDRLSGGIFGWNWTEDIAITDADALVAFQVLSVLPLDIRERLFRAQDTGAVNRGDRAELLDKMERNLPDWFKEGPEYRSLAVERDAEGRLRERGRRLEEAWNREGTAGWLIEVRRLIRDGKLSEAFTALDEGVINPPADQSQARTAQAPGAPAATTQRIEMTPDVRAAIVDRLDAFGVMDGFIEDLPYNIRQGRDHRLGLLRICTARSIPHLLRHIDSLLRLGLFDWAVRSWEADLAYVMFRALPPHEQRRFGRIGEITSELSADARTWSGTNLLDAPTSEMRLRDVRRQLNEETLWRASRMGQLRALVGLAIALGDGRTPFECSRRFEAYRDASLQELVARFSLYDPRANRTVYEERTLENLGIGGEGPFAYGKLIFGLIWVAIRDAFAGDFALRLDGTIRHDDFDLNELGDLLGGQVGGARFAERRGGVSERANLVGLEFDQRNNTLHLSIPELAIDGLGILRETWVANVGRIRATGLVVDATFETHNLRHPRQVQLRMDHAGLDDILYTTPTKVHGAAGLDLTGLRVTSGASSVAEHSTTGRGFWTYIPIFAPLAEWAYLLFQVIGLGLNGSKQLGAGITELRSGHVETSAIRIEGMHIDGFPIESITTGPIRLGWGGTEATYLQEQKRAVDARLAALDRPSAASDPAAVEEQRARLTAQLAEIDAALPRALDDDRELDNLMRRSQTDPSSLSSADHRRIRELQSRKGGLTVDAGPIQLTGIGDLATSATIERVSGDLSARLLAGSRLTDAALAEQFTRSGPPENLRSQLEGRGRLDLGRVDVVLTPPSLAQLRQWREDAERAGGVQRVAALDQAIEERQELDALLVTRDRLARDGRQPARADVDRVEELTRRLAAHIQATDAYVGLTSGAALTAVIGARRVTGSNISTRSFGVDRLDVTDAQFPITNAGSAAALLSLGRSDITLGGERTGDRISDAPLHVRQATLTGVRVGAGDDRVGTVTITGLTGGTVSEVPEGIRITDLRVDSIEGREVRLHIGSHGIDAPGGVAIEGITANVLIPMSGRVDQPGTSITGAVVESLTVDAVRVLQPVTPPQRDEEAPEGGPAEEQAPIRYTNLEAGITVSLYDGALRDIWAENVTIDATDAISVRPTNVERDAEGRPVNQTLGGIGQIDGLRLAAAIGHHNVRATLNSPAPGDRSQSVLTVGTAAAGGFFLDLRNLTGTDASYSSPDGTVRVRRLDLGHGRLRFDGDHIVLEAFEVPQLVLGSLSWKIGDTGRLNSVGGATLTDIRATADARLEQTAGGDRRLAEFTLPELSVGSITAEDLRYRDGPLDISLRRLGPTDPAPVSINNLRLTDVHWQRGQQVTGRAETGPVGLAVDAGSGPPGAALDRREWGFIGQLYAGSLYVSRDAAGVISLGGENVGAVGDVHVRDLIDTHVDVSGLTVPELRIEGNTISVPAGAGRALRLGRLELSALRLSAGGLEVSTSPRQNITLEDLGAAFSIELEDVPAVPAAPGRAATPASKRLKSVTIPELDIGSIATTGLRIAVPGLFSVTLSSTGAHSSSVRGIRVRNLRLASRTIAGTARSELGSPTFDTVAVDHIDLRDVAFNIPIDQVIGEDVSEATELAEARASYARWAAGIRPAETWIAAFEQLIDNVTGHINFDLFLPIRVLGMRPDTWQAGDRFKVRVAIVDGEINVAEVEDQAAGGILDMLIDFEVKGNRLVVELDLSEAGALAVGGAGAAIGARGGPVGAAIGAGVGAAIGFGAGLAASQDLVTWELTPAEARRANEDSLVRLRRLLVPLRTPPTPGGTAEIDFGAMALTDVDIFLSITNAAPITITLPDSLGTLDFAADTLHGLRITAPSGIPGRPGGSPRVCAVTPPLPAGLNIELDWLRLTGANLNLPFGRLTTGGLRIENLRNGRLALERLALPTSPAKPTRPNDTALGIRLRSLSGVAGTLAIDNVELTGTTSATPGGGGSGP
jgi:Domain of unknown function (DUF4157)